ncbi:MAG: Zn-ribbon domain-containing OB-fold protein [Caldilineaceae bacterium]
MSGATGQAPVEQAVTNLSGRGEVYSFSIMYNVPHGFEEQKPYAIALVRLDEGPMVTAQLTDVDNGAITIGMRVEMVTRKLREDGAEGQIIYGYKFRPLLTQGGE